MNNNLLRRLFIGSVQNLKVIKYLNLHYLKFNNDYVGCEENKPPFIKVWKPSLVDAF